MTNHPRLLAAALAGLALLASAPAAAQSDILLQLRSGSPAGDRFRVDSAGGFVAVTQLGIGIIPASGAGYRFMYHPFKAALRFGHVSGTEWDDPNVGFYSFAGGESSQATAFGTFAFGDQVKVTGVDGAGFGGSNEVGGTAGFTAGASNNVCGFGSVAIGFTNTTGNIDGSGNCVAGDGQGAVAIGYRVTADADYAVAIGHRASADNHSGVFVFGDESTTDSIEAVANNEFAARAAGGYRFRTNATLTTGCNLPAGSGVFSCSSSRMLKDHFGGVDGEELLGRVRGVPVNTWSYVAEGGQVRHLGPVAEDFRAAFGLGVDDRSIGLLDIDGVNFAGVKALEARTTGQAERIRQLEAEVDELRRMVEALVARQQPRP
jgi:hypothetical protein